MRRCSDLSLYLAIGCVAAFGAGALIAAERSSAAMAASTGYHVIKEIKIGGDGGWDYLTMDSAARRLYISHATHTVVVDVDASPVVNGYDRARTRSYSLFPYLCPRLYLCA